MNYELKSIHPVSVLLNAMRVLVAVGLIAAVFSFFILPNPNIGIPCWWQKIFATVLFTFVYTLVASAVLFLVARIYNSWLAELETLSLFAHNVLTFSIAGAGMLITRLLLGFGSAESLPTIGATLVTVL